MYLDGCCLGGGLEAYGVTQLFESGLGLLQLCVKLFAVRDAVQLNLGQLDVLDRPWRLSLPWCHA